MKKKILILIAAAVLLYLPRPAKALSLGTNSVGQQGGDFSLMFGIDYKMIQVTDSGGRSANMSTKGFSLTARYNIISALSIFAYGGFSDIWLDNPNFQGYLGGSYGGGMRLSLPDPSKNPFTVNLVADASSTQSGNSARDVTDFEYGGAVYLAFKAGNSVTYGGVESSDAQLSFTNPNHTYDSRYNVGAIFGMDQFIIPKLFFNFEAHVFDEDAVEGSIGYTF